jgi:hypothetical protein
MAQEVCIDIRWWNPDDDEYLRTCYSHLSCETIASELGVGKAFIEKRCKELGLVGVPQIHKHKEVTE